MKTSARKASIVLSLLLLTGGTPPVMSCGPFFDQPIFVTTVHPDIPLAKFAAGDLGVLQPTYARSYLVVAYRYLTGKPLSTTEAQQAVQLWRERVSGVDNRAQSAVKRWTAAAEPVLGKGVDEPYPTKSFNKGEAWFQYTNCPSEAFDAATSTLNRLTQKYGVSNPSVKDWARAQSQVFCNCGDDWSDKAKKKSLEPLPASSDPELRALRTYQIAAAEFYTGNFESARKMLGEIASDKTSPYHRIAPYLAIRAQVRQAVVAEFNDNKLLADAAERLRKLQGDSEFSGLKQEFENLSSFIEFKVNPEKTFTDLATSLSHASKANRFGCELGDFTLLFDNFLDGKEKSEALIKSSEMAYWIEIFQDDKAKAKTLAEWKSKKTLPWLAAALCRASGKDAEAQELIKAAAAVEKSSPLAMHALYHRARLLNESGDRAGSKVIVDEALATPALLPSTRNLFVTLRLSMCLNFSSFADNALERPAVIEAGWNGGLEVPDDFDKVDAAGKWPQTALMYSDDVAAFLNQKTPLSLASTLLDPRRAQSYPLKVKKDIAQSLFLRSWILQDKPMALKQAAALSSYCPEMKPSLAVFQSATDENDRQFAATLLVLRNPGMRPFISAGLGRATPVNQIDDFQDNWWTDPLGQGNPDAFKACLTQGELAQGEAEAKKLKAIAAASIYLPSKVLAYAKVKPQDPRLAEALSLAVRATKFGDRSQRSTALSKQCFQLLHSKFPKSPWTQKTKYWY